MAWDAYAFLHQPLHIFDANIYYPYANTLAYSENLIGSAFFAAPIIWLTGNLVLAMNLTALLTCVLCGTGAYLLARRLHFGVGGAFICGLDLRVRAAAVLPHGPAAHDRHAVDSVLAGVPAFLFRAAAGAATCCCAIACFSLQALASGHGAAYLLLSIAGADRAGSVAFGAPLAFRQRLRDVGVAGAYLIAPAVWVMLPYRFGADGSGPAPRLSRRTRSRASRAFSPRRRGSISSCRRRSWGPFAQRSRRVSVSGHPGAGAGGDCDRELAGTRGG